MGGSAQTWTIMLQDDLDPGGDIELRLVLTKFSAPSVDVSYEIALQ